MEQKLETAILASGCFWCTEAVYQRISGVKKVTSGYTGGRVDNPTYEQVSMGNTGHAEAIQIEFNPMEISYEEILDIFWKVHDPTTLNKQGADVGTQYRSAIFYTTEKQKKIAEQSKKDAQRDFQDPIITEVVQAGVFYEAENYHQNFYNQNRNYPYCRIVIDPKIKKLQSPKETPTNT
jgi:peptide-methionine (S)-S-oxide reductase